MATLAGIAALWLAHHGPAAIKQRYGGTTQEVFRLLVTLTCRTPPGWDGSRYGAGIVDAKALLEAALPARPSAGLAAAVRVTRSEGSTPQQGPLGQLAATWSDRSAAGYRAVAVGQAGWTWRPPHGPAPLARYASELRYLAGEDPLVHQALVPPPAELTDSTGGGASQDTTERRVRAGVSRGLAEALGASDACDEVVRRQPAASPADVAGRHRSTCARIAAMATGQSELTLRFLAAPTDVAFLGGSVHGGRVLEWIDKAAYALAVGWSGHYCVTAYVGNIHFARPIEAGHLVEVHARMMHTGRSSMDIQVTVSSADPQVGTFTPATKCLVIFVAVDGDGRSTAGAALDAGHLTGSAAGGQRRRADHPAEEHRDRDGGPDLHRRRHRAAHHHAFPGRPHRRELGRQGARRHRHAMDRRGGLRGGRRLVRRHVHRRVFRRCAVLPARSRSGTSSRWRLGCCAPGGPACTSPCTSGPVIRRRRRCT